MLFPALLTAALAASPDIAPASPELSAFTEEASAWLLEGEPLPRDYRLRLMRMHPADRLQAIVFLRRSGLLRGDVWRLEEVLAPALDEGTE